MPSYESEPQLDPAQIIADWREQMVEAVFESDDPVGALDVVRDDIEDEEMRVGGSLIYDTLRVDLITAYLRTDKPDSLGRALSVHQDIESPPRMVDSWIELYKHGPLDAEAVVRNGTELATMQDHPFMEAMVWNKCARFAEEQGLSAISGHLARLGRTAQRQARETLAG